MPKRRLDEARVLAAVAANDPPASADHLDDDEWHAFSCKVSDPAFVVGMRTVPLIPAGIWKPSSMSVINCR